MLPRAPFSAFSGVVRRFLRFPAKFCVFRRFPRALKRAFKEADFRLFEKAVLHRETHPGKPNNPKFQTQQHLALSLLVASLKTIFLFATRHASKMLMVHRARVGNAKIRTLTRSSKEKPSVPFKATHQKTREFCIILRYFALSHNAPLSVPLILAPNSTSTPNPHGRLPSRHRA